MSVETVKEITVRTEVKVPIQRVEDLLCSAFEGGSNYFYTIEEFVKPDNFDNTKKDMVKFKHLSYPLNKNGALIIADKETECEKKYTLNYVSLVGGLQIMAEKYPRHFNNFITEDDDSETGDVFLQCCLFGEVIYG